MLVHSVAQEIHLIHVQKQQKYSKTSITKYIASSNTLMTFNIIECAFHRYTQKNINIIFEQAKIVMSLGYSTSAFFHAIILGLIPLIYSYVFR